MWLIQSIPASNLMPKLLISGFTRIPPFHSKNLFASADLIPGGFASSAVGTAPAVGVVIRPLHHLQSGPPSLPVGV
ncbi:hypothetical protein Agabi119p4_3765 [Agaricus bisporus var. burnettii]|uniref:Uncharacterized protein n=1 Tax=Agaricus bisporus var. burnettii TaxID=192524 RepID=A0A8H7F5C4_AGABI|nr:hypothetical protein Agabi119p4_3765 [Agaricus bisporus var. burnettii]